MTKPVFSLNGDEYSDDQKKGMWSMIHYMATCPLCGATDSFLVGPRGGLAVHVKCSQCHIVFFTSPFHGIGAYPISIDNPPQGERR